MQEGVALQLQLVCVRSRQRIPRCTCTRTSATPAAPANDEAALRYFAAQDCPTVNCFSPSLILDHFFDIIKQKMNRTSLSPTAQALAATSAIGAVTTVTPSRIWPKGPALWYLPVKNRFRCAPHFLADTTVRTFARSPTAKNHFGRSGCPHDLCPRDTLREPHARIPIEAYCGVQ